MVELNPISRADVSELAPLLRHPDMTTYLKVIGTDHIGMIDLTIRRSVIAKSVRIDGDLVALIGLICEPTAESIEAWIYTSTHVERHRIAFLRACRQWRAELASSYPNVHGWVDARFDESLKMMAWLGLSRGEPIDVSGIDAPIYRVEI